MLADVRITFRADRSETNGTESLARDHIWQVKRCGCEGSLTVVVPVAAHIEQMILSASTHCASASQATGEAAPFISLVPCLFTLGVNEMQTLTRLVGVGEPELQSKINRAGLTVLEKYRALFSNLPVLSGADAEHSTPVSSELVVGEEWKVLRQLVEDHEPSEKDVALLLDSARLCRIMNGGRTTCCKSAKDRTSMASTLEFASIVAEAGLLGSDASTTGQYTMELANLLRGPSGCRLRNCKLNTGKAQYAFNSLQQSTLPDQLKPPPKTAGGSNVS